MKKPLDIALHFLKFRPRTIFEIKEKLKSKKISEKEISEVITVLKRNQLLDDEKFAKMWIADRNRFRPSGSFLLKLELKKLGVKEEIIEKFLQDQDEEKLAKEAIEMKHRYQKADFQKKAAFLQRRGFATEVIYKILKK